jgi:hypothetical protein
VIGRQRSRLELQADCDLLFCTSHSCLFSLPEAPNLQENGHCRAYRLLIEQLLDKTPVIKQEKQVCMQRYKRWSFCQESAAHADASPFQLLETKNRRY